MLSLLCTGTLLRNPERRTSAKGNAYATALLRVPTEGEDSLLVSLIAFDADAVAKLLALSKGDTLAVTGRAKLTEWTRDGEQRHGLSVTVERVLTAYEVEKKRARARGEGEDKPTTPSKPSASPVPPHEVGLANVAAMADDLPWR